MSIISRGKRVSTPGAFVNQTNIISKAQKALAQRLPTSSDPTCQKFKTNQFKGLMNGTYKPISKQRHVDEMLLDAGILDPLTNLGTLPVELIHCDYDFPKEELPIVALDLHINRSNWCTSCVRARSGGVDFLKGDLNSFSCWRRGGTSKIFGFLFQGTITVERDMLKLRTTSLICSDELFAKIRVETSSQQTSVIVNDLISRWSNTPEVFNSRDANLLLIKVDLVQNKFSDSAMEVKNILTQQLLSSKNVTPPPHSSSSINSKLVEDAPEVILKMLEEVHRDWTVVGASENSKGLLGLYVVDNGSELFSSSTFQSSIKTFCDKHHIEFKKDSFDDVNHALVADLQFELEPNQFALLMVLDPILDLGGMRDD